MRFRNLVKITGFHGNADKLTADKLTADKLAADKLAADGQ
ncbi:MAG: hypothetical protein RLZZ511_3539 [Cyanobacteriota bacterium]|jgi:hypothetical protein